MFTSRLSRIGLYVSTKYIRASSYSFNKLISNKQLNTDWTNNRNGRHLVGIVSGMIALKVFSSFNDANLKASEDNIDLEEKFGIDLNEIYEECAIVFLHNKLVNKIFLLNSSK